MSLSLSRLTVFCKNADRSLAFYRDLLGLVVVEDKVIEGPAAGALLQLPPCRMRIVFLAASAETPNIVGLFQVDLDDLATGSRPWGAQPPARRRSCSRPPSSISWRPDW